MGRGGEQHQSIQQRLKALAEELGFRATIEKVVLDGQGSVDLALEKESCAIACEIAITTTTDHEFGNIKKCIKAGLEPPESSRVQYFTPDQFISWLRDFAPTITAPPVSPPAPTERTIRGYKVRRTAAKLSEEERRTKEELALKAMAETMKKPRK